MEELNSLFVLPNRNSPEEQESDYPPEINCPHYYPARQPLRVTTMSSEIAQ